MIAQLQYNPLYPHIWAILTYNLGDYHQDRQPSVAFLECYCSNLLKGNLTKQKNRGKKTDKKRHQSLF